MHVGAELFKPSSAAPFVLGAYSAPGRPGTDHQDLRRSVALPLSAAGDALSVRRAAHRHRPVHHGPCPHLGVVISRPSVFTTSITTAAAPSTKGSNATTGSLRPLNTNDSEWHASEVGCRAHEGRWIFAALRRHDGGCADRRARVQRSGHGHRKWRPGTPCPAFSRRRRLAESQPKAPRAHRNSLEPLFLNHALLD